jgi:(p)ppGpp synthase/HD superfamily hydrolase
MGRRIARTAGRLAMDAPGQELVLRAYRAGMARRMELDDHHPDHLHPARTALILMDDAGVGDPHVLAAALVTETRDGSFQVEPGTLADLGPEVEEIVAGVPAPDAEGEAEGEGLLEALVTASPAVLTVALAERLDHARHLHLRPREEWESYHGVTCQVYAAAAQRGHPALAGRITWWCATFRDRFLRA